MEEQIYRDDTESKFKDSVLDLLVFIGVVIAILVILRWAVVEPHRVLGHSMVPNFQDGDYIITNKLVTHFSLPQRGEVIILYNPRNHDQVFIKRVIGLPGEKVKVQYGQVYINDQVLSEPYLPPNTLTSGGAFLPEGEEFTVGTDQYFVMGDNRGGSSDSREWGPLQKDLVVGQALLRYWPPQKAAIIKVETPSN
jgi:signal peptidase I